MIDILIKVVKESSEIIKNISNSEKKISYKGRFDIVTNLDVEVENSLKLKIKKELPDYTIIAEESGIEYRDNRKKIYIDPIDGTTNFAHGLPFYAISVGAYVDDEAVAGVVYNPVLDELFYAEKRKGAYLNGKKIMVSQTDKLEHSLIVTGFPYGQSEDGNKVLFKTLNNLLLNSRGIRRLGSASIDLCYVAKGIFEGYYESNLKSWDVAAGKLIVMEAGGTITDGYAKSHNFDSKVIVSTNGKIHNQLIDNLEL